MKNTDHRWMNLLYTSKFIQINISRSKLTLFLKPYSVQTVHLMGQGFSVKMALHDLFYAICEKTSTER